MLGYKKPSEEVFEDIKRACIDKWNDLDNTQGYVTRRVKHINQFPNEGANVMTILNSLHPVNRAEVMPLLSDESKSYIMYFHETNQRTSPDEDY
jgi:hypothetical protein